jgi:hypothetical protein
MKNRHRVSQVVNKLICSRRFGSITDVYVGAADRGEYYQAAGAIAGPDLKFQQVGALIGGAHSKAASTLWGESQRLCLRPRTCGFRLARRAFRPVKE